MFCKIGLLFKFKFRCINQPDTTTSQVYYLTFMYSSTCFGRPHAHFQELNNCSSSLWFYCWSVVVAVLLVMVGPVLWPFFFEGTPWYVIVGQLTVT